MIKAYIRLNGSLTNIYIKNDTLLNMLCEIYTRFGVKNVALVTLEGMGN